MFNNKSKHGIGKTAAFILLGAFLTVNYLSGCSPTYIAKAGWEEAQILWGKEPIPEVLSREDTSEELKKNLSLVLDVRKFCEEQGLTPGGSYTEYYDIKRDVLVWVLSAAPKESFAPHTWWFPIVGSVPYKGFFDKEQGLEEARDFEKKGYDIYLRPSPAFSTLGWFKDPFLSTMVSKDEIATANLIIHELLHNTLWIRNHVSFNETMANVTGAAGAIAYFEMRDGPSSPLAAKARERFEDELLYADYLGQSIDRIEKLYKQGLSKDELLEARKVLFEDILKGWGKVKPKLKSGGYSSFGKNLNNAVILSRKAYFDRYGTFYELYKVRSGSNFSVFLEQIKKLAEIAKSSDSEIWQLLEDFIASDPVPATP
jgi:predicted aminopeptidase